MLYLFYDITDSPLYSLLLAAVALESAARELISSATTTNPRPASPALAASIEAFKASRFVCDAIATTFSLLEDNSSRYTHTLHKYLDKNSYNTQQYLVLYQTAVAMAISTISYWLKLNTEKRDFRKRQGRIDFHIGYPSAIWYNCAGSLSKLKQNGYDHDPLRMKPSDHPRAYQSRYDRHEGYRHRNIPGIGRRHSEYHLHGRPARSQ